MGEINDMTFSEFEEKVEELVKIRKKANNNAQSEEFREYIGFFWNLYDVVLGFEESGKIEKEPGKKNIGYLREILRNDGPEYCYTIEFWPRGEEEKRYSIGVCVRGWPILEKVTEVKDHRRKTLTKEQYDFSLSGLVEEDKCGGVIIRSIGGNIFIKRKMSIKRMSFIAMMTCLLVICSWLTIPAAVPFTMQTFAVFCCLILLGGKSGLTSLVLYAFMGIAGIPVFSGFQGGIGHIVGPTGGYIIGLIIAAAFYSLLEPLFVKSVKIQLAALIGGLFICYLFGTLWFKAFYGIRGVSYSFYMIISICVIPYIIPDIIKLVLAWIVSKKVRKAIMN